jgi:hypothetical protein
MIVLLFVVAFCRTLEQAACQPASETEALQSPRAAQSVWRPETEREREKYEIS